MKYRNDVSTIVRSHPGICGNLHSLAHTQSEWWIARNQFFSSQQACISEKMPKVKEGDGTLLGSAAIKRLPSMMCGKHDAKQPPAVLLGGMGGRIESARSLRPQTPHWSRGSLFLHMTGSGGLELESFGDSAERLPGIV